MRRAHLVNYTLYQIGWFACVLGGALHRPWTGCLIALTLVGVHLTRSLERSIEVRLMALATVVGAILEMVQIATVTYRFTSGTVIDVLPPAWLLTMWAQFAKTFRHSLRTVICAGHRKRRYLGRSGGPSRSSPASASARSRSWSR